MNRVAAPVIPSERLAALNAGRAEAATLAECLSVDQAVLIRAVAPGLPESVASALQAAAGAGITRRMVLASEALAACLDERRLRALATHPSDTVRGWAALAAGRAAAPDLPERLARMRRFADDPHFGVREWAWFAVRPHIAAEIAKAIEVLAGWTGEASANLRRFAAESTRPRGVWAAHIPQLKRDPAPGLAILEPLRADPARYVQDSVANWINDAAKTRPDWALGTCKRWRTDSKSEATLRICRRALRSVEGSRPGGEPRQQG
jgi:3-methyladenine DNA glycosylase AlkC